MLLREVQTANLLGFTEGNSFRQAVKEGIVPQPAHFFAPQKRVFWNREPAWSEKDLKAWIDRQGIETDAPPDLDEAFESCEKW